jgi:hypothetical protein
MIGVPFAIACSRGNKRCHKIILQFDVHGYERTFGAANWNMIFSIGAVDELENKAS